MDTFISCVAQALLIFLQGSAKQVHVQKQRAPAKVDKKKVVAPMPRRVWRRKAPTAEPSRADQEGGCGVVGTRDLKMGKTRDAFVDITPPFPADPHALRTTLFEGGEDDTGTTEKVKPNFRTPPS